MENPADSLETSGAPVRLKPYLITLVVVWTLLLSSSLTLEIRQHQKNAIEFAKLENWATYNKDLAYRRWASMHGGVYVPVTEQTLPNPYLSHIKERDITTPSGKQLTLMNPAYMTRQVFELSEKQYGIRAHITSLNPLNPKNAPDEWEAEALKSFENGGKEATSVSEINGEKYMRLMMPMMVEKGCLKCHEQQGYKVGDIRGGISVSSSLKRHLELVRQDSYTAAIDHIILWVIGLLGILIGGTHFNKQLDLQNKTERELMENTRRLKEAQGIAKVGNWELNLQTNTLYWSDEIYHIFDMDPKEFGASYEAFLATIHPEDREMVDKAYWKAVKEKVPYELTHRILTKAGTVKYVHEKSREVLDETGSAIRSIGTVQDVTQLKEAETALRDSEERFRAIFDEAGDSILLIEPETTIFAEFNDHAHEDLGYTREEFKNLRLSDLEEVSADEHFREHLETILRDGRDSFETQHLTKDGIVRDVMVNAKKLEVKNKTYIIEILRDITERKLMIRELRELNKNLELRVEEEVEKSRRKDQVMFEQSRHIAMAELLVNIAHQWRQPICAIGTIAQDMEDAYQHKELDGAYLKESVGLITKEVRELSETINQFRLFFVKEVETSEFNIHDAVLRASRMVQEAMAQQKVTIKVEGLQSVTKSGYANEFTQAVYNIFHNSVEAAEERKMEECRIQVSISHIPGSNKTRVSITDSCGGIDAEILDRVFDPYYTTRAKQRGKGIGLFMTKAIIETNMLGRVRVENVPDGASFTIEV